MTHKLILELPTEVYDPLADAAKRAGATLEQLAIAWLACVSRRGTDDPLEKFIGAIRTNTPDWTDQHDKYLGQALTQTNAPTTAGS